MTFAVAMALAARPLHPAIGTCAAALCSLAAMATLSLTGILGPALIWTGYLLLVRDSWRFKTLAGAIAGAGLLAALLQAHELGILSRFAHLDTPGTSIYFRLSAPYRLISESIERFPLGYPLGQTDFIASRHYYINWEHGSQTNVDNTLLMIVFYFGLLGIVLNVGYVLKAAQFLVIRRHAVGPGHAEPADRGEHDRRRLGAPFRADDRLRHRGRSLPAERAPLEQPEARLLPFTRRRSAGPPAPAAPREARSLAA